jgi:hypothetical protein
MVTETGHIKIDPELLNKISKIAKKENTTENKIINDTLKKMVETTENKIPDYLIANKDTYNPDSERMRNHAGFIKNCKPFNAVKLVRETREGKL